MYIYSSRHMITIMSSLVVICIWIYSLGLYSLDRVVLMTSITELILNQKPELTLIYAYLNNKLE